MVSEVGEELTKDERLRLDMCSTCMKMCKDACPTLHVTSNELHTPYNRSLLITLHEKGIKECDERALEGIFSCLLCEACQTECLPKVDFAGLCRKARGKLVAEGRVKSLERVEELSMKVVDFHNPLGEPAEKRASAWEETLSDERDAKLLYFVGCIASYREPEIARATINVLKALGKDLIVLKGEEWCCGSPIISTGNLDLAQDVKRHNVEKFKQQGVRTITTACPACYNVLKSEYKDVLDEAGISVKYILEIVQETLNDLKLEPLSKKITYHDPCHLGRKAGIYDIPREILKRIAGSNFTEMELSREKSRCCGSGGGVRHDYPDICEKVGLTRFQDSLETSAEILVTSCPLCKFQFKEVVSLRQSDMRVMDLIELIELALVKK